MSPYELDVREGGGGVVLAVASGELDLTNAQDLERRLETAAPEDARLVLDLNAVGFLDSAVVHVLFRLARVRGKERFAIVVAPGAPSAGTLAIVGLDRVVPLAASRDALVTRDTPR